MKRFKKGDRVRLTGGDAVDDGTLYIGAKGTVLESGVRNPCVEWDNFTKGHNKSYPKIDNSSWVVSAEDLELIDPYEFKVGDNRKPVFIHENLESTLEQIGEYQQRILGIRKEERYLKSKMEALQKIVFNKKTLKTTLVFENDFGTITTHETKSNEKDFVDFRVGFLIAWLKEELKPKDFRVLISILFRNGKPKITFLQGYSLHYFESFRQMNKVLEAIKTEKENVNIGGKNIDIVWKG